MAPLPNRSSRSAPHLENAAAFFRLLRTAPVGRVEDHAIAGLQRRRPSAGSIDHDAVLRSMIRATRPISTPRWRGARPFTTA
jgi:hypothetical protein